MEFSDPKRRKAFCLRRLSDRVGPFWFRLPSARGQISSLLERICQEGSEKFKQTRAPLPPTTWPPTKSGRFARAVATFAPLVPLSSNLDRPSRACLGRKETCLAHLIGFGVWTKMNRSSHPRVWNHFTVWKVGAGQLFPELVELAAALTRMAHVSAGSARVSEEILRRY